MRSVLRFFLPLAVMTALAGCLGGLTGGTLVRAGEPTGAILVRNGSNATLTVVTVSQCSAASHGLNRLPDGKVLNPGQSWQFTVSQGCYDVQAGYGWNTGYSVADFNNIYVPGGQVYTLTVR